MYTVPHPDRQSQKHWEFPVGTWTHGCTEQISKDATYSLNQKVILYALQVYHWEFPWKMARQIYKLVFCKNLWTMKPHTECITWQYNARLKTPSSNSYLLTLISKYLNVRDYMNMHTFDWINALVAFQLCRKPKALGRLWQQLFSKTIKTHPCCKHCNTSKRMQW